MKRIILLGGFILAGLMQFALVEAAIGDPCASMNGPGGKDGGVAGVLLWAHCVLTGMVTPLLFAVAMVAFIWGVIQFYINPDNEEKRKNGKNYIIGGLIGLFVMIAMWGLVGILTGTFGFSNGTKLVLPQLPEPQ
jgi:hypothetical protein